MYHEDLINKLVKEHSHKDNVIGIVLYGSHALGTARPDSDVDLYIITNNQEKWMQRRVIDGVAVGLNMMSQETAARKIIYRLDPSLYRSFKEGKILYSSDPSIEHLKKVAEEMFKLGGHPTTELSRMFKRKRFANLLEDLERLVKEDDPVIALYTMNFTFNQALESYYKFTRWTRTKRTYVMKELKEGDKFLYKLCNEYLQENNLKWKYKCLKKIVKYILEPHGGLPPEKWQAPLEIDEEVDIDLKIEDIEIEKE